MVMVIGYDDDNVVDDDDDIDEDGNSHVGLRILKD